MFTINGRIQIADDELTWSFVRSGGPGGQNVNKVASKAVLRWRVNESPGVPADVKARFCAFYRSRITQEGELVLSSQRFRDQDRNRQDCLDKLREMLELASVAPRVRKKTRPTRGSQERRLAAKRHRAGMKQQRRLPTD